MIENINWYPGHMKKTRELIEENLRQVDLAIEVRDARIPISSKNPVIDELVSGKERIVILNKTDLADDSENRAWLELLRKNGSNAVLMDSNSGTGLKELYKILSEMQERRNETLKRKRPLRMMIVGVPNVGKSSLINRLTGKKSAKTGDRPGVTRGKQWLALENGMQLLDTPGILWPKFEDPNVGLNLAFCGSIKDEIMDRESLALELLTTLARDYPDFVEARYKVEVPELLRGDANGGAGGGVAGEPEIEYDEDGVPVSPQLSLFNDICLKRGFILPGKRIDYERAARTILDEFRSGTIGRITLETSSSQAE